MRRPILLSVVVIIGVVTIIHGFHVSVVMSSSPTQTRRDWLTKVISGPILVGAASVLPGSVSASSDTPTGLPASGSFVQHAVINVNDMDANIKFFCDGLGMKVLRQRTVGEDRNVFVGYGKETLTTPDGGYFSLELVKTKKDVYIQGASFQYIGLTLPETLIGINSKAIEAGGQTVPHWFLEKDFVELKSPDAITVRVKRGSRRDPFTVVALGTNDLSKSEAYFKESLGMTDQGGLLGVLGPLAGNGKLLGYDKDGVAVALVPVKQTASKGELFDKLAILTKDTVAKSELIEKSAFGSVLFAGEVPGIGTKVANTIDKENHGVVFVDYADFEKEFV